MHLYTFMGLCVLRAPPGLHWAPSGLLWPPRLHWILYETPRGVMTPGLPLASIRLLLASLASCASYMIHCKALQACRCFKRDLLRTPFKGHHLSTSFLKTYLFKDILLKRPFEDTLSRHPFKASSEGILQGHL